MRANSVPQKPNVYAIAAVAVGLTIGASLLLANPFAARDYAVGKASSEGVVNSSSATASDSQPALLDPALRSLDGVAHHG